MIPAHRLRLSRDARRRLWLRGRLGQAPHGGTWLLAMAATGTISGNPAWSVSRPAVICGPNRRSVESPARGTRPGVSFEVTRGVSYRTMLAGPGPACRCDPSRHDVLMVIAGMARMMPLGPLAGHGCGGSREAVQFHG